MSDIQSPVTVTTGSRSPSLPSYVARAEGSVPCPLSIKYKNFHLTIEDYEVAFQYHDFSMEYLINPLQGSISIIKVRDAYAPTPTPSSTPNSFFVQSTSPFLRDVTWRNSPPTDRRPRLSIRVPHPEMAASPQTPSPLSCDDPDGLVHDFLAIVDDFVQAATNSLNNHTWLPNTCVTQLLLWLPAYLRNDLL